jgi:CheY-like chemotaxis protein
MSTPPPQRVLVVEDNEDCLMTMVELLHLRGVDVRSASNGGEALTVAQVFRPDVVLLDIALPVMDGYEVARALRADPRTSAALIIAVSGWGMVGEEQRCNAAGIDIHMLKPVAFQDLYTAMQRARVASRL